MCPPAQSLSTLVPCELLARRAELLPAAGRERLTEQKRDALDKRIAAARERLAGIEAERESAQGMPRRERKGELARLDAFEAHGRKALSRLEGELEAMPAPGQAAREELALVERALVERRQLAITDARISPPAYITAKLGQRPLDPAKRRAWDRGVELIERHRQEQGINDRSRAFGAEPRTRAERACRETQLRRLRELQRQLGREGGKAQARELRRGLGIGR